MAKIGWRGGGGKDSLTPYPLSKRGEGRDAGGRKKPQPLRFRLVGGLTPYPLSKGERGVMRGGEKKSPAPVRGGALSGGLAMLAPMHGGCAPGAVMQIAAKFPVGVHVAGVDAH